MQHNPGFLALVEAHKEGISELSESAAKQRLAANPAAQLMDVREDNEWQAGHFEGAVHLGKGVLERDIETAFPDKEAELLMYCGGGYRSILTCAVAQKMGYRNVHSICGGFRGMLAAGWKTRTPS